MRNDMAEMMDRTSRIQQKLTRLRSIDREQRIFGADYHQYELAPPTSEQQIRLFESTHGIELPEDYRAFLTEIGNGGAGPYYGLLPLDNTISEWSLREDAQYLSKPFPLPVGTDNLWQGTLRICEFGCAIEFLLVETGSERGHVWV